VRWPFALVVFSLLLPTTVSGNDVSLAPLVEVVRDAKWIGVVQLRKYEAATYVFEGKRRGCGFLYTVEPLETVWGTGSSSVFFANFEPPREGATLAVVLHEWTDDERRMLRRILEKSEKKGAALEEARCRFNTGGVDQSGFPMIVFDEEAAKKYGGRWVRTLEGAYWSVGDAERQAGASAGVFSWGSVREQLLKATKGLD
jgi:hypothetical protein